MESPRKTDDYFRLKTDYLRFKGAVFDPITGLYSLPILFDRIRGLLERVDQVGVFSLEIAGWDRLETQAGWNHLDRLRVRIVDTLVGLRDTHLGRDVILASTALHGGEFLIFLPELPGGHAVSLPRMDAVAKSILGIVMEGIQSEPRPGATDPLELEIGFSILRETPVMRFERQVYRSLEEARRMRRRGNHQLWMQRVSDLRKILRQGSVQTYFQPIVDINTKNLVGYEALTRGPRNTFFETPNTLFDFSQQIGASTELDGLCRFRALADARGMEPGLKLFLNSLPATIQNPFFRQEEFWKRIQDSRLTNECIVIEITERTAIEDFPGFRREIDRLRERGFQVAIDDIGTGYANLQAVSEVHPDFLKVDMSLIRHIDRSLIKKGLVSALVEMGRKIGSRVIAEGIEREEELQALMECGVQYGQGFYFGEPAPAFVRIARPPGRDA